MSRNYELLHQVGKGRELFQPPKSPKRPVEKQAPLPPPAASSSPILPAQNEAKAPAPVEIHRGSQKLDTMARAEELKVVQHLLAVPTAGSGRAIMFSGVADDAGSLSICARSAQLLAAQSGTSVCLVDANLASPSLHAFFGVENHRGLADAIRYQTQLRDCARRLPSENLWLVPAGESSNGLLASVALRSSIEDLRQAFEYVLVFAPAVSRNPDSLLIGQLMDGVFLVLEAETTRREAAKKAKEDLEAANARLLGVVLNNRKFHIPEPIYRRL